MARKYKITIDVTIDVLTNAIVAPNLNHTIPVILLASIVHILWKLVKVPIAVAVSFLSVIFEIHALAIPSVDAA